MVWALLIVATVWLSRIAEQEVVVCMFRNVTGVPCPTCGLTRATESILHGNVITAIALNPLAVMLGMMAVLVIAMRIVFGVQPSVVFSATSRKTVWIVGLLFVLLNWGYVIWHELWTAHPPAG